MDKLPDEVLEKIALCYRDSPPPYWSPQEWMNKKRWSEEEERLRRAGRAVEKRATLAALARSSRSLSRVVTPLLYEYVHLDSRKRSDRFLRTYTGHINPWSRERKPAVNENCNAKKLCIDFSEETRPKLLPNLRLLRDLGHFARLQSLKLCNVSDPTDTIPDLLQPFSMIRTQLKQLEVTRRENLHSAELAIAFVLELPLYIPEKAFVLRGKDTEQEVCFGAQGFEGRDVCRVTKRLREECRTNYALFVSLLNDEYDMADYFWPYDPEPFQNPPSQPSPFIALTSLSLTIDEADMIRLLLETPVVRNLKHLRLTGSSAVEEAHIILLRRSFSLDNDEDGYCKSPKHIKFAEDYRITRIHRFLLAFIGLNEPWPGLEQADIDNFGEYLGPSLHILDLADLSLWAFE